MASVGAATAAHRRQQHELYKSLQRSKQIEARSALRSRAVHILRDLSPDGEFLDGEDLASFFALTFQVKQTNPHAMQRVIHFLGDQDQGYARDSLFLALERYQEYLNKEPMIEGIFERYNRARDGQLTKHELCRLLQDQERKNHQRYAGGMAITLIISPQDLNTVIQKADRSGNGKIDRSELIPAMDVWERLAQEKLHLKQMSACGGCIIL